MTALARGLERGKEFASRLRLTGRALLYSVRLFWRYARLPAGILLAMSILTGAAAPPRGLGHQWPH